MGIGAMGQRKGPRRAATLLLVVGLAGAALGGSALGGSALGGPALGGPAAGAAIHGSDADRLGASGAGFTPVPAPASNEVVPVTDNRARVAPASAYDALAAATARPGGVRVIVGLRMRYVPEGRLSGSDQAIQRAAIARLSDQVVRTVQVAGGRSVTRFTMTPAVVVRAGTKALAALQASDLAATVQQDGVNRPQLNESTTRVQSSELNQLGFTGAGQMVAVIDSGVDAAHPFFGGRVVEEACYTRTATCPNGQQAQTGPGSGVPCTFAPLSCRHGTHVAGIVAGEKYPGNTTRTGVAPEALVASIQVMSRGTGVQCPGAEDPCGFAYDSDQILGLERVNTLTARYRIAAANISIGGGLYGSNCDDDPRKPVVDTLRSKGVAVVVSSGNDGSGTGVSAPACISSVVTVGSVSDADAVSGFSNSSSQVEVLAPGETIDSSVPGGGFAKLNGTSMAAPHVAGAWAVLKSRLPGASVADVLGVLQTGGIPITDPRNNVTRSRIALVNSAALWGDTGFRQAYSGSGAQMGAVSQGVGLATRGGASGSGSITIAGVPVGAVKVKAFLYWATIGGRDPSVVFNGSSQSGTLVGIGPDTCWGRSANRVYRADVTSRIPAAMNGTYTVSGISGAAPLDGHGASLVVVYRMATGATGRVVIRDGAIAGYQSNQTMGFGFTGLKVATTTQRFLHVGMADGQPTLPDGPLRLRGTALSGSDWASGSDGPMWDDVTYAVPEAALPAGITSAFASVRTGTDCLLWTYAALDYR